MIAGEYGPTADTVRRAAPRLTGAKRVVLDGYEAQGWSDTAADCTGELVAAMTAFLSQRAADTPKATGAGSHAEHHLPHRGQRPGAGAAAILSGGVAMGRRRCLSSPSTSP